MKLIYNIDYKLVWFVTKPSIIKLATYFSIIIKDILIAYKIVINLMISFLIWKLKIFHFSR